MIKINHICELKIDRYNSGRVVVDGIILIDYQRTPIQHPNHQFICFGYKGKDIALSTWAMKKSSGLGCWSATADKRLLWNTHLFYERTKVTDKVALKGQDYRDFAESELDDISWLGLVTLAYKAIPKDITIHIIYLSKHDYPSAKIYYDYCCWLKNNI